MMKLYDCCTTILQFVKFEQSRKIAYNTVVHAMTHSQFWPAVLLGVLLTGFEDSSLAASATKLDMKMERKSIVV